MQLGVLRRQADKRGPPGAVIEGKAKRYKAEDGPEAGQQYTAAQVSRGGYRLLQTQPASHLTSNMSACYGDSTEQGKPLWRWCLVLACLAALLVWHGAISRHSAFYTSGEACRC
jgi:hypothetical protein